MSLRLRSLVLSLFCLPAFASNAPAIRNWAAPPVINVQRPGDVSTDADLGSAAVFTPVTPCRVVDTRLANGTFGGPKLTGTRTFSIPDGPCTGIPAQAQAFSVSLTVTGNTAGGFITAYPAGTTRPLIANITWTAGQTLSTGSVIAATSGDISVYASTTTHFTLDVNGYYIGAAQMNVEQYLLLIGSHDGSLIKGFNKNTTSGEAAGVEGRISGSQSFAAGVWGVAEAETGATTGVWGSTYSTSPGAAGVVGVAGAGAVPTDHHVGVFGGAAGYIDSVGVVGKGTGVGIVGARVDEFGETQTMAIVGGGGDDGFFTRDNLSVVGTKSFVEPDPEVAGGVIKYVALEGPEAGTYFRGSARARNGRAVITVPKNFRSVTDREGLTVQITPVGEHAQYYIATIDLDRIVVHTTRDIEFFYLVNGVRRAFKDFMPVQRETEEGYFVPTSPYVRLQQMTSNPEIQRRLIENGTFHADGSVNLTAAEAKGWAAAWRAQEAAAKASAQSEVKRDKKPRARQQ